MPQRRSNIGRSTSSAIRVRLSRSNENDQKRDIRLLLDRERLVYQRPRETSVGRTVRYSFDHGRNVTQRARESSFDR